MWGATAAAMSHDISRDDSTSGLVRHENEDQVGVHSCMSSDADCVRRHHVRVSICRRRRAQVAAAGRKLSDSFRQSNRSVATSDGKLSGNR